MYKILILILLIYLIFKLFKVYRQIKSKVEQMNSQRYSKYQNPDPAPKKESEVHFKKGQVSDAEYTEIEDDE